MPVWGLCQPKELLNTRAHVDSERTKECIGRESNPGLADIEIADLEWQRPILPLNHQCDESDIGVSLYVAWCFCWLLEPKTSNENYGQSKKEGSPAWNDLTSL
jgi:hypothetical protein